MGEPHEAMDAPVAAAAAAATTTGEVDAPEMLHDGAQSAATAGEDEAVEAAVVAPQEHLPPALDADTPSDAWHTTEAPEAAVASAVGADDGSGAGDAPSGESAGADELLVAAQDELVVAAQDEPLLVDAASASNSSAVAEHEAPLQPETPAAESEGVSDVVEAATSATGEPDGDGDDATRLDGGDAAVASAPEAEIVEDATAEETAPEVATAETTPEDATHADVVMAESEQQLVDAAGGEAAADVEMAAAEQQDGDGVGETAEPAAAADGDQAAESPHQNGEHDPPSPSFGESAYDPAANLSHAQDEYDPAETAYEQHGSDEYDPANPSAISGDEYDPENPAYDPPAPSYDGAHGSPSGADAGEPDSASKRKASPADEHPGEAERDAKRQRSDSRDSSKSLDAKPRRGSDARGEDKKGLSDAAWDRLKDFQTLGEFQINQVSRAAFASLGSLPEFAQVSIISRFTRVPLKGVRDKNGQLMRIHHEYLKENPHVASLQSVSVFVADYTSDPGLFEFGYAPPFPVNGMSTMPVPYQKSEPATRSRASSAAASASAAASPSVDEFGRAIKKADAASPRPSSSSDRAARAPESRKVTALERAEEPPQQATAVDSGGGSASPSARKPFDPRRRLAEEDEPSAAALPDPRRAPVAGAGARAGGEYTSALQSGDPRRRNVAPPQASAPAKSELYDRLPASVKSVLDAMIREGRLRETINDNVISRLNHLPEHVALRAVENFSNVDLTHIDNLQGFLVGIINRVNEKAIAAERADASSLARGAGIGGGAAGAGAGAGYSNDSGAVLGYPGGTAGRPTGRQGVYNRDQADGYRSTPSGMNNGAAGGYSQQQQPYGASSAMHAPSLNVVPAAGGLYSQQQQLPPHHFQSQFGIHSLPLSVQQRLRSMAASGAIASVDELSEKCYELLSQLSEGLANEALTRFMNANLATVRNLSGFLIGVVKRCRQEYGFN